LQACDLIVVGGSAITTVAATSASGPDRDERFRPNSAVAIARLLRPLCARKADMPRLVASNVQL
jgi:hypothetical protein